MSTKKTKPNTPPLDKEAQDLLTSLNNIHRVVKRLCRPPIDTESLSLNIWLEHWTQGKEVHWTAVRNRCVDEIRHITAEKRALVERLVVQERGSRPILEPELVISSLIERSHLSGPQRLLLFEKWFLDKPTRTLEKEGFGTKAQIEHELILILEELKRVARHPAFGKLLALLKEAQE